MSSSKCYDYSIANTDKVVLEDGYCQFGSSGAIYIGMSKSRSSR
jgi:hypothetical protein